MNHESILKNLEEAVLAEQRREWREWREQLFTMKPAPAGILMRRGKTVVPRARANLPAGTRKREVVECQG